VGIAAVKGESRLSAKVKIADVAAHHDWTGRWIDDGVGRYELTYRAERAGHKELYLWYDQASAKAGEAPAREALPGAPFIVHVTPGPPVAAQTHCEGWSLADKKAAGTEKKKKDDEDKGAAARDSTITAGDAVSVRVNGVDQFGNATLIGESALSSRIVAPNGSEAAVDVSAARSSRGGSRKDLDASAAANGASTVYELRHETSLSGRHEMHVLLHGEPVRDSPVSFEVEPAAPTPSQSMLVPPAEVANLPADLERPVTVLLSTCDKFGNRCNTGGLRIAGRLMLVKTGVNDNSILMPNNHTVTIEDRDDGTYEVHVAVMIPATVKLIVNMDKDLPGVTGELPPLQLSFARDEASSTAPPSSASPP
jgi:hypothetical protein